MATRGRGATRECPAEACPRAVRPGHLMCAYHWRTVPAPTQRRVWATWRAWSADMTDEKWDHYIDARADALTAAGIAP